MLLYDQDELGQVHLPVADVELVLQHVDREGVEVQRQVRQQVLVILQDLVVRRARREDRRGQLHPRHLFRHYFK